MIKASIKLIMAKQKKILALGDVKQGDEILVIRGMSRTTGEVTEVSDEAITYGNNFHWRPTNPEFDSKWHAQAYLIN